MREKVDEVGCEWVVGDGEYVTWVFGGNDMLYVGVWRREENV